jgi:rare lipoprotein A
MRRLAIAALLSCAACHHSVRAPPEPGQDPRLEGLASFYGPGLEGHLTASGERFDPEAMTAAHRTLPFGSRVRVTNLANDLSVIVRINDRGPYAHERLIDLSLAAARQLDLLKRGVARVRLEILDR